MGKTSPTDGKRIFWPLDRAPGGTYSYKRRTIMEKREREILKVLFATKGNIKVTAGILGFPEGVVRRYLRRRDFCRRDQDNVQAAIPPEKV